MVAQDLPSDPAAFFRSLNEAIIGAQARNAVLFHILRDVVIDLARTKDNPETFVQQMFERVSSMLDQTETTSAEVEMMAEMRWVTNSFFTRAGHAVKTG